MSAVRLDFDQVVARARSTLGHLDRTGGGEPPGLRGGLELCTSLARVMTADERRRARGLSGDEVRDIAQRAGEQEATVAGLFARFART